LRSSEWTDDMESVGRKIWAIPEGFIPSKSVSDAHDLVSHDAACFLNVGDHAADVVITLFFKDREPVGPYRLKIARGARSICASTI
jgi:hypothetical protein